MHYDLSQQIFDNQTFKQFIESLAIGPTTIHINPSTLSQEQKTILIALTALNEFKSLKITTTDGSKLGAIYTNWTNYAEEKKEAYERGMHKTTAEALTFFKQDYNKLPEFILDFGAGTGQDTINLALKGCPKLWAVDGDEISLNILQNNLHKLIHTSEVTSINSPFINLTVEKRVDLLVSSYTLPYRTPLEFPTCWNKCVSLIKPGGYLSGHFFGAPKDLPKDLGMTYHTESELRELLSKDFEIKWLWTQSDNFTLFGGDKPSWGDLYHVVAKKKEL